MITQTFTLPIGIEIDGVYHREGELEPRKAKHMLAAANTPEVAADKNLYEVCCLAQQIITLGDIPKKQITGTLIADLYEDDFDELAEAAQKARQRVSCFRAPGGNHPQADAGADEAGI